MKKIVSIILTAAMVLCMSVPMTFAADSATGASASAQQTTFSDISGKDCESAVNALVKAGIINGFSDGTFRPDANITRAQACTLISKAFPKLSAAEPGNTNFVDVGTYNWYSEAVAYCAANHIVQGDGNGFFRPEDSVSNYEIIAMLVRAKGLADDKNMSWPGDYVAAAQGIDMLKGVSLDLSVQGNQPATRGNVSVMLYAVADISSSSSDTPSDPSDIKQPSQPSKPSSDVSDLPDRTRIFGFVTSTGRALNSKGDDVGMIDFYCRGKTYTLLERSSSTGIVAKYNAKSGPVILTLRDGAIDQIYAMSERTFNGIVPSDKSGYPYTITQTGTADTSTLHFYKVKDEGKTYAYYDDGTSEQGTYIGINNPCVVYTCKADGSDVEYEVGSNSDISEGSYIAAFAVDKDSAGVADVVLVVDEDEAANLLEKVDGTNAAYKFK